MTQISPEARERLAKAYGAHVINPDFPNNDCALSAIQKVLDERDALNEALEELLVASRGSVADWVRRHDAIACERDALRSRVQELEGALRPFRLRHDEEVRPSDSNEGGIFVRTEYLRSAAKAMEGK